jgi:hypothetical protein
VNARFFENFSLSVQEAGDAWRIVASPSLEIGFAADRLVASVQADAALQGAQALHLQVRVSPNHVRWTPWLEVAAWRGPDAPELSDRAAGGDPNGAGKVETDHFAAATGKLFRFAQVRAVISGGVEPRRWAASARTGKWMAPASDATPPAESVRADSAASLPLPLSQHDVPGLEKRACSPTATAWAIRALSGGQGPSAEDVAQLARDARNDLYGNWPRAVFAAGLFGVEGALRFFASLNDALEALKSGAILVCSLRYAEGELPGAPQPHTEGHLVAFYGWDAARDAALCCDPAHSASEPLPHAYPREAFLCAWLGNKGLAYVLKRS